MDKYTESFLKVYLGGGGEISSSYHITVIEINLPLPFSILTREKSGKLMKYNK